MEKTADARNVPTCDAMKQPACIKGIIIERYPCTGSVLEPAQRIRVQDGINLVEDTIFCQYTVT
jgi:hypothetical protein